MDITYEVVEEGERNKKVKVNATGKKYLFRIPKFVDRDKIIAIITKAKGSSETYKKAIDQIARKRKMKSEDVMDMILKDPGCLEPDEEAMINESSDETNITAQDQVTLISVVLDMTDDEKDKLLNDMGIDEGVALCKAAMEYLGECIGPSKEDRKK